MLPRGAEHDQQTHAVKFGALAEPITDASMRKTRRLIDGAWYEDEDNNEQAAR